MTRLPSSAVDLPVPSSPSIFFGKPGVSIGTSMSSSSRNVVRWSWAPVAFNTGDVPSARAVSHRGCMRSSGRMISSFLTRSSKGASTTSGYRASGRTSGSAFPKTSRCTPFSGARYPAEGAADSRSFPSSTTAPAPSPKMTQSRRFQSVTLEKVSAPITSARSYIPFWMNCPAIVMA